MGSGGVGKSAVTVRFVNGSYLEWYDPTIEDSYRKQFTVDDQACLLEILDTAGVDQYLSLNDLFIRESEGFVLVFSLNDRETLREVLRLRESILRVKDPAPGRHIPTVLVDKADLVYDRQVEVHEGEKLAARWGCHYFETSARAATNILPVFEDIVRQLRAADVGRPERIARRRRRDRKCIIL